MEPAQQVSMGTFCNYINCFTNCLHTLQGFLQRYTHWVNGMVYCRHSQTPVDELLGKPYQDVMLAIIESYQDTKTNGDTEPPDDSKIDEFDDNDDKESVQMTLSEDNKTPT